MQSETTKQNRTHPHPRILYFNDEEVEMLESLIEKFCSNNSQVLRMALRKFYGDEKNGE